VIRKEESMNIRKAKENKEIFKKYSENTLLDFA
jgi:hypothetical protein